MENGVNMKVSYSHNSKQVTTSSWRKFCHQVDYILFIKADVDVEANPNEAQDTRYVTPQELKDMFKDEKLKFTPWFKLICESMLFEWWEHLDEGLERYLGERQIRRMWRGQDMVNGYRLRAFLLVACFKLPLSEGFFFASSYIGPGTSLRQRYDPTQ